MAELLKVFKGTDKDMKCRGMQYEIGKTETADGAIRCGDKGFHSCEAPLDVLQYYPMRDGNRYFVAEAGGKIDRTGAEDSKLASSELTLKAEIGIKDLIKAHFEFTRKKAESGTAGGYRSNLAGGDSSNLAGGYRSNLAGGYRSNLAGGYRSNLAGGYRSNLAGGDSSNLAGGDSSNLAGGDSSNLAGGDRSNLAGGDSSDLAGGYRSNLAGGDSSNLAGGSCSNLAGGYRSNLAGGDSSNLAGGDSSNLAGGYRSNLAGGAASLIVGRNAEKAKGGLHSVIVLTEWKWNDDGEYVPVCVKAEIVDGERIKADTWYTLKNGEFTEVE